MRSESEYYHGHTHHDIQAVLVHFQRWLYLFLWWPEEKALSTLNWRKKHTGIKSSRISLRQVGLWSKVLLVLRQAQRKRSRQRYGQSRFRWFFQAIGNKIHGGNLRNLIARTQGWQKFATYRNPVTLHVFQSWGTSRFYLGHIPGYRETVIRSRHYLDSEGRRPRSVGRNIHICAIYLLSIRFICNAWLKYGIPRQQIAPTECELLFWAKHVWPGLDLSWTMVRNKIVRWDVGYGWPSSGTTFDDSVSDSSINLF